MPMEWTVLDQEKLEAIAELSRQLHDKVVEVQKVVQKHNLRTFDSLWAESHSIAIGKALKAMNATLGELPDKIHAMKLGTKSRVDYDRSRNQYARAKRKAAKAQPKGTK